MASRQETHKRTTWPPKTMVMVEEEIGRDVLDYLAELIAETGSVERATEALAAQTTAPDPDWPVQPQTIREWWDIACRNDPERKAQRETAREDGRAIARLIQAGTRAERQGLLAEITQVRNGIDGKHCQVDGTPLPTNRKGTCSSRCGKLWIATRYHLSEERRERSLKATARWVGEHPEACQTATVRHYQKVADGTPIADRGRWITSPAIQNMLEEVMRRRRHAKAEWGSLAADLPTPRSLERPARMSA